MTAKEQALLAAEAELKKLEEAEANEAQERSERIERKLAAGLVILNSWFPDVEWDVIDDGEQAYYSELVLRERDSDLMLMVQSFLNDMNAGEEAGYRTRIYVVAERPTAYGYRHWEGPEVKSPADIGRWLIETYS